MIRHLHKGTIASAIAIASALTLSAPAHAGETNRDLQVVQPTTSAAGTHEVCLDAVATLLGDCEASGGLDLGIPSLVSTSTVLADPNLTAAQKAEIVNLASAGTVRTRTWAQHTTSGFYVMRQNGRVYYDGVRVWVTQSYRGATGFHNCGIDFLSPGWQINTIRRSDTGTNSVRYLNCRWNTVEWPIPITRSWDMTATLRPNGTISGFWTSLG